MQSDRWRFAMSNEIFHNKIYLSEIHQVLFNGTIYLTKKRLGFFPLILRNISFDFEDLFKEHDISLPEHFLMCNIDQDLELTSEELVNSAVSYGKLDFRGGFSKDEFLVAIDSCVEKGIFQFITTQFDQCDVQAQRINSGSSPESKLVEFTNKGYILHRKIVETIFGKSNIQYNDSGWSLLSEKSEIHVYGETQELCQIRIHELEDESEFYFGAPIIINDISQIEKLDEWKPNKFITLFEGYRYIINYDVVDPLD